ncbi:HAUS augmin-like complex subunit 3 isoform X2 [Dysidea avara]|uniref:HAUS augmin-like complex subunit 3 isoform X2 n=1 Tax=Dysidea avara TaxID=196820 RepID=UPI00331C1516
MSEDLGAQFCQASSRLPGLPKLQKVPDELLENDRIAQFLQWFCCDVHTSNVLTTDEITRCQEIKRAGNALEGGQLQAAIDRMEGYGCLAKDASTEQLRREISDLQTDVVQARDHLDMLVHLKGQLDRHHSDLLHKKDTSEAKERSYQQQQQRKLHMCKRGSNKLNEGFEQLKSTVENTMDMYKEVDSELNCYERSKPATEQSSFLSAYSLDSYHSLEEKFTQALVAYTRKQFFQGIADLSSHSDINDDLDPSHDTPKMDEELKEIQRLQAIYPVSEVTRINSEACEKQTMATVECAEKQLMLLSQASYVSDDEDALKANIVKLQQELSDVNVELKRVGCDQLPNLVQEMANLQFTSVLTADHDLKLARQDYFTSKQDKVIDCLRSQLSRHQLVLMLYELELRKHRELYKLLKAVQLQLAQWKEDHDQKIKLLQELPQVSTTLQPRQALNPMDKVTFGVYKLLENGITTSTTVPTFTDLLSSCTQLVKHIEHLKNSTQLLQINQLQQTAELERTIFQYEQLLKRYNAEVDPNQPTLVPKDLRDVLAQLTESANKLEIELKQIMQDFNAKKKMLATNPWLQKERELFVNFFTNPARLQQIFSELAATVDSNSLLQSPKTTL